MRERDHSKTFLIRTAAGVPFVPVFSSGQFVSIRGTANPSCIQPLNHPWTVREPDTVHVAAHYSTGYIKNQSARIESLLVFSIQQFRSSKTFTRFQVNCFFVTIGKFRRKNLWKYSFIKIEDNLIFFFRSNC